MSYHSQSPGRSRATSSAGSASANGDHTFGFPMAPPRESAEDQDRERMDTLVPEAKSAEQHELPPSPTVSITGPSESGHGQRQSENPSLRTVSPNRGLSQGDQASSAPSSYSTASRPDISTAAQSFVTMAPTLEGTSGSSEDTHGHARDGRHHHHQHPHVHDPSSWGPV